MSSSLVKILPTRAKEVRILQSAAERRLAILEEICERRYDTVSNLADEFCVSKRTIRRDIIVLSCSYPIYAQQGGKGGVYIAENFRLGKSYLSKSQAELLTRLSTALVGEDKIIMESILATFTRPDEGRKANENA